MAVYFNLIFFKTKERPEAGMGLMCFEQERDRGFFVTIVSRAPAMSGVGIGTDDGEFAFALDQARLDFVGVRFVVQLNRVHVFCEWHVIQ